MRSQTLGRSDLHSSVLSYGCMRIPATWDPKEVTPEREKAGIAAVHAAWDAGYTLFDHADIYCRGEAERIYGLALKQRPEMKKALVATKCGIRFADDPKGAPHRYDFSYAHIMWSCEQSLRRLGVERIDLYQLHRPDLLADPDDIARAFSLLHTQGKVRSFGVSNFLPSLLSAVQSALPMPLIVNQVEIHPARLDCFSDGILDQCQELQITPLAWSPLAGGALGEGGKPDPSDPRHDQLARLIKVLDKLAKKHEVSRTVICLAWLLKHPSRIIPIVGSVNPARIRDAVKATEIHITREEWYEVLLASRGKALP